MSRLGVWQPSNAEERLDRLESLADIRQLPVRYALAVDSATSTLSLRCSDPTCASVVTRPDAMPYDAGT